MAAAAIDTKFRVPVHYVSDHEEAEEGDHTCPQFIQQQFVGNLSKMDSILDRVHAYDMSAILGILLRVHNPNALNIALMFYYEQANILINWDHSTITWETR